ncbi:ATP-dependent nuclease [Burkholderia gladioli]|uniref:ATP-dependent nuclease n=1 Tax=Burkholderia gladioli TaxID=28095 RepID=UPI001CC3725A|nr:AAA family ATPase [Burkholderia gladioli]
MDIREVATGSIQSITFKDGTTVNLGADEIVAIVGPNNSGKSALLREILERSQNADHVTGQLRVITDQMTWRKSGDAQSLFNFIAENGSRFMGRTDIFTYKNHNIDIGATNSFLRDGSFFPIAGLFISMLDTSSRLSLVNSQNSIDFSTQSATHPFHYLHQDLGLMGKLNMWFKRAFGTELGIDYLAGASIPMYVGPSAAPIDGEHVTEKSYRDRLRSYDRIESQGDGMKAFAAILMHTLLGQHVVNLIDEPEAFLHPPHARLLARILVENYGVGQLFFATHSGDFLRGLIESSGKPLRILRITRTGNVGQVKELSPLALREAWRDPVLRYSNTLDGIFHEKVVICEGDGDCRFYGAIADGLRESPTHPYVRDLMFVQSGGKGGATKLIKALRVLGVSISAVLDFDILTSTGDLRNVIDALGGNWSDYSQDYNVVRRSIDELGKVSSESFRAKLLAIANDIQVGADEIDGRVVSSVKEACKVSIGRDRAKSVGLGILDRTTRPVGERLLAAFAQLGLYVVPSGELESFVAAEPKDKNEWVAAVLEQYGTVLASAQELRQAREFVASFILPAVPPAVVPQSLPSTGGST